MPMRRKAVPSPPSPAAARGGEDHVSGRRVGSGRRGAGAGGEGAVLSFSVTPAAAKSFSFSRRASFSHSRQSDRFQRGLVGEVALEGGLGADALRLALGADAAGILAPRAGGEARAFLPEARRGVLGRSRAASWPSVVKPAAASSFASAGPTPGSRETGCGASQAAASPRRSPRSRAACRARRRASPSAGCAARPMETVTPISRSTVARSAPAPRRRGAVQRPSPRGRAPPRRSTAAARAASALPSARGCAGLRRRISPCRA
jgi:hypothetical protein